MSEYERIVSAVMIKPVGSAIYAEGTTTVEVMDEGAGAYVVVSQEEGKVGITAEEWPMIRSAIDDLLHWCEGQKTPETRGMAS